MTDSKKDVPSLEDALKSEAKDDTTKTITDPKASTVEPTSNMDAASTDTEPAKTSRFDRTSHRRIDKAILEQEERLSKAMRDENGDPRVAKNNAKRNPPSSKFPERIPLNEYNERLAAKRRAALKGKKSVSKEKAEENKEVVSQFKENYENQPFSKLPSDWSEYLVRSTPGADDAPAFSSAEKVAGSGSKNLLVVEKAHDSSSDE